MVTVIGLIKKKKIRNSQFLLFPKLKKNVSSDWHKLNAINRYSIVKYCYIEFSTIIIRSSIIKIITASFMNNCKYTISIFRFSISLALLHV